MSTDRLTEVLNYLSAMSRDFGEFRQEFKQHRQEFQQFRDETNARLEKIEQRLDKVEQRITKVEGEVRQMRRLLDIVGSAVLAGRAGLDELEERVADLESKQA